MVTRQKKTTTSKPPDGFHPIISYASLVEIVQWIYLPELAMVPLRSISRRLWNPNFLLVTTYERNPLHIIFVGQNPHSANLSTLHQLIASSLNPCKFHLQRYVAKGTQNDQSGIDILSLLRIRHGLRGIRILFFSLLGNSSIQQEVNAGCFPFLIPISYSLWLQDPHQVIQWVDPI